jgi:hypothetical protein
MYQHQHHTYDTKYVDIITRESHLLKEILVPHAKKVISLFLDLIILKVSEECQPKTKCVFGYTVIKIEFGRIEFDRIEFD